MCLFHREDKQCVHGTVHLRTRDVHTEETHMQASNLASHGLQFVAHRALVNKEDVHMPR